MRSHPTLLLPAEHREQLERILRARQTTATVQARAQILLLMDEQAGLHLTDGEIAARVMVSRATVVRVRHRYFARGIDAILHDKPRPGQPPKITGEVEAHLTVLACSDPPEGYTSWTLRLLADRLVALGHVESISHTAVGNRLKKTR